MDDFQREVAQVGLAAVAPYGFALAGGNALVEHGVGDRATHDLDFFAKQIAPARFAAAVEDLVGALREHRLGVDVLRQFETFATVRASQTSGHRATVVDLGVDYRQFPPKTLRVGPVLDIRDAVAGKVSAFYSRLEVRDAIDFHSIARSGRWTLEGVLAIADQHSAEPLDRGFLAEAMRGAVRYDETAFADYGVDAAGRARIVRDLAVWADHIDPRTPRVMPHMDMGPGMGAGPGTASGPYLGM